jgi:hypothetical protein
MAKCNGGEGVREIVQENLETGNWKMENRNWKMVKEESDLHSTVWRARDGIPGL